VQDLKLETRHLDDLETQLLVTPKGPIRARNSEAFREQVDALMAAPGTTSMVIDLSQVDSVDSATAGYFLNVHDRLSKRGGKLALARLSTGVQVVIDSIGLTTFFLVCQTVEDGVEAINE
jgi:anti-anti-sigma factor